MEQKIWEKLNQFRVRSSKKIAYSEINERMKSDPTNFMTVLDTFFMKLTEERARQLSIEKNMLPLTKSHFRSDMLGLVWDELRVKYQCNLVEYKHAKEYLKYLELYYTRDLSYREVRIAFRHLMYIAVEWESASKGYRDREVRQPIMEGVEKKRASHPYEKISSIRSEESPFINNDISAERKIKNEKVLKTNFINQLKVLQSSSKESVVHADSFGDLQAYMHVSRPIEKKLIQSLSEVKESKEKRLILLGGSVGDGKSHLLSYIKENYPTLLEGVLDHNDSTESYDPNKDSISTLEKVLASFNDGQEPEQSQIIAINLGILQNFYQKQLQESNFKELRAFIDKSGVFTDSPLESFRQGRFEILNFMGQQAFELTNKGPESTFFKEIIEKITQPDLDNPFYQAWKSDADRGVSSVAHKNYEMLMNPLIKNAVIQTLIEVIVKEKVFISVRTLYNFIYEIIVPVNNEGCTISGALPNLLYGYPERSPLLEAIHELDPLKNRMKEMDKLITSYALSEDPFTVLNDNLKVTLFHKQIISEESNHNHKVKLMLRQYILENIEFKDSLYREFLDIIYAYYTGQKKVKNLFDTLNDAVLNWKGSPRKGYVFIDPAVRKYRMAVKLDFSPAFNASKFNQVDTKVLTRFSTSVEVGLGQSSNKVLFELDYKLYRFLKDVQSGYRPNYQDNQDALQFVEFYESLINLADRESNVLVVDSETNTILVVKKPSFMFNDKVYEVEKV